METGNVLSNWVFFIPLFYALVHHRLFRLAIPTLSATFTFSMIYHVCILYGKVMCPDLSKWLHIDELNAQFQVPIIAVFLDLRLSRYNQENVLLFWLFIHALLFAMNTYTEISIAVAVLYALVNIARFQRFYNWVLIGVFVLFAFVGLFCWTQGQTRLNWMNHALWHVFIAIAETFAFVAIKYAVKEYYAEYQLHEDKIEIDEVEPNLTRRVDSKKV